MPVVVARITGACTDAQFSCASGSECIDHSLMCDGLVQCADASDEESTVCEQLMRCKPHQYQCANRVCINEQLMCNKDNDCGDW